MGIRVFYDDQAHAITTSRKRVISIKVIDESKIRRQGAKSKPSDDNVSNGVRVVQGESRLRKKKIPSSLFTQKNMDFESLPFPSKKLAKSYDDSSTLPGIKRGASHIETSSSQRNGGPLSGPSDVYIGTLKINFDYAKDLVEVSDSGVRQLSDAFCKCQLPNRVEIKSRVVASSLQPEWRQVVSAKITMSKRVRTKLVITTSFNLIFTKGIRETFEDLLYES